MDRLHHWTGFLFMTVFIHLDGTLSNQNELEILCKSYHVQVDRFDISKVNVTIWYDETIRKLNENTRRTPVRFHLKLHPLNGSMATEMLETIYLTFRKGRTSKAYENLTDMSYDLLITAKCSPTNDNGEDPCDSCATRKFALYLQPTKSTLPGIVYSPNEAVNSHDRTVLSDQHKIENSTLKISLAIGIPVIFILVITLTVLLIRRCFCKTTRNEDATSPDDTSKVALLGNRKVLIVSALDDANAVNLSETLNQFKHLDVTCVSNYINKLESIKDIDGSVVELVEEIDAFIFVVSSDLVDMISKTKIRQNTGCNRNDQSERALSKLLEKIPRMKKTSRYMVTFDNQHNMQYIRYMYSLYPFLNTGVVFQLVPFKPNSKGLARLLSSIYKNVIPDKKEAEKYTECAGSQCKN